MKLFLAVSALVAVAIAQEQCSSACAPQPVTIQLSCNSNSQRPSHPPPPPHHPPPHHGHPPAGPYTTTPAPAPPAGHEEYYPAPAPAPAGPPEHYGPPALPPSPQHSNFKDDPNRASCMWRNNGAGTFFLDGDTTNDFYLSDWFGMSKWAEPDPYDRIRWWRKDAPKPPRNWDGSADTLGFPAPEPGTELHKLLVCWPLLSNEREQTISQSPTNINNDPDIQKCSWIWNSDGFASQFGNVPGGFPSEYRLHRADPPHVTFVQTPYMVDRPPLDWDGNPETLGFPMPQKGTHEYNVLLCHPFDFRFGPPQDYQHTAAGK